MTSFFIIIVFLNIHQSGVLIQCYLIVTWLVPCKTAAILAHTVYTIQPCTRSCHFLQSHIHRVHVCLVGNLPPALLAKWPGSFTCYCDNTDMEQISEWESAQKSWPWGRIFSCQDPNPRPFDHKSSTLTTELSPLSLGRLSKLAFVFGQYFKRIVFCSLLFLFVLLFQAGFWPVHQPTRMSSTVSLRLSSPNSTIRSYSSWNPRWR